MENEATANIAIPPSHAAGEAPAMEAAKKPVTHLVAATAGFWTAAVLCFAKDRNDWSAFGISSGFDVFGGHYWSLITSVFVHVNLMHIGFNLSWLLVLGTYMEERYGGRFYALFMLACAFCSSTFELSASGETGVGLSGVVYGIFGFLWGTQLLTKVKHDVLDAGRIWLFVGWLFVCVFLTEAGIMPVANAAHVIGLLFGMAVALGYCRQSRWAKAAAPTLIGTAALLLAYSPWSYPWLARKAFNAQSRDDLKTAESYYSRILQKVPDDEWAIENLAEVREALGHSGRKVNAGS